MAVTNDEIEGFLKKTGDLKFCNQSIAWQADNLKLSSRTLLEKQKQLLEYSQHTQPKNNAQLLDYKFQAIAAELEYLKDTYGVRSVNNKNYLNFYGRFFGCPVSAKSEAAKEMIFYLNNIEYDAKSSTIKLPDEQLLKNFMTLDASIFGRLGKIRSKMLELLKEAVAVNQKQCMIQAQP